MGRNIEGEAEAEKVWEVVLNDPTSAAWCDAGAQAALPQGVVLEEMFTSWR